MDVVCVACFCPVCQDARLAQETQIRALLGRVAELEARVGFVEESQNRPWWLRWRSN